MLLLVLQNNVVISFNKIITPVLDFSHNCNIIAAKLFSQGNARAIIKLNTKGCIVSVALSLLMLCRKLNQRNWCIRNSPSNCVRVFLQVIASK